eukprot:GHVO01049338.1.p1 GENE.GHVO01049338.1~~GHVO01049338.1.p1  ORF type:complete len:344 (+),score=70.18 GHVO01049338.1:92-1033(+)
MQMHPLLKGSPESVQDAAQAIASSDKLIMGDDFRVHPLSWVTRPRTTLIIRGLNEYENAENDLRGHILKCPAVETYQKETDNTNEFPIRHGIGDHWYITLPNETLTTEVALWLKSAPISGGGGGGDQNDITLSAAVKSEAARVPLPIAPSYHTGGMPAAANRPMHGWVLPTPYEVPDPYYCNQFSWPMNDGRPKRDGAVYYTQGRRADKNMGGGRSKAPYAPKRRNGKPPNDNRNTPNWRNGDGGERRRNDSRGYRNDRNADGTETEKTPTPTPTVKLESLHEFPPVSESHKYHVPKSAARNPASVQNSNRQV